MLKPRSKTHVNHSIDVGQKCYVKNRSLLWMLAKKVHNLRSSDLRKKIDERFRVFYVKTWLYEAKAA